MKKFNTYIDLIDCHKGEDCFVLASGPSLYDIFYGHNKILDLLKDKVVISINASIMACVDRLGWLTEGDKRYWISDDSLTTRWSWWKLVERSKCVKIVRDSWLKQKHYGNIDLPSFLPLVSYNRSSSLYPLYTTFIVKHVKSLSYCNSAYIKLFTKSSFGWEI